MFVGKWPRKEAVYVKAPLQWWANELTNVNTWKFPVILYFCMKNSNCTEDFFTKGKFSLPHVVHPSLIIWVNDYKWVLVQVISLHYDHSLIGHWQIQLLMVFRAAAAVP